MDNMDNLPQPQSQPKTPKYNHKLVAYTDLQEVYKGISEKYSTDSNSKLYREILKSIDFGRNKLAQNMFAQSLTINTDWIDAIQDGLIAMQKIVDRPKLSIKDERELVKLERAKRVDAVAVRHLSTHTQFIKVIRDDGTVVPSQIMTRELDEDKAIYENRFLYALLQRVKSFVNKRYNVLIKFANVKNDTALAYSSSFQFGKASIDCRFNIDVKTEQQIHDGEVDSRDIIARLEKVRQMLMIIEGSSFMQLMRKAKPVYPPIQKTNIFTSNPEYATCYNLWLILSSYDTVGYAINTIEKQLPFDNDYYKDLTKLVAASVQVMLVNNEVRDAFYAEVPPTRQTKKEFKVQKSTKFLTNVFESKKQASSKDINQYYYERIKSMVMNLNTLADALSLSAEDPIPKKAMFRSIYKQIETINEEMFTDILNLEAEEEMLSDTESDSLELKIKVQKQILERYKQIATLKAEGAQKAKAKEEVQQRKLDRLLKRLERIKEKSKKEKEVAKAAARREAEKIAAEKKLAAQKEAARKAAEREAAIKKAAAQKEKEKLAAQKEAARKAAEKKAAMEKAAAQREAKRAAAKEKRQKLLDAAKAKKQKLLEAARAKRQKLAELAKAKKQKLMEIARAKRQKELAAEKARKQKELEAEKARKKKEKELAAERAKQQKLIEAEKAKQQKLLEMEKAKKRRNAKRQKIIQRRVENWQKTSKNSGKTTENQ